MGRLTEYIAFLNDRTIPNERSRKFIYSYINTDVQLKEVRKRIANKII